MKGIELLDEFRQRRSEAAFGELVRTYTNLVFSVTKRRLTSQNLAQDAAQTVFIRLAEHPPKLNRDAELAAWLHRTAVHVSIDLWRSECRRRVREQHAAAMQLNLNDEPSGPELAPALDEALNELHDADRQAILLRFFQEHSMRELGKVLNVSEDAAKMRVSRALDRLRDRLGARGLACSGAALSVFLADRATEAAPAEVAEALAVFKYPMAADTAAAGVALSGFLGSVSVAKMTAGAVALVLAGAAVWWLVDRDAPGQKLSSGPETAASAAATDNANVLQRAAPRGGALVDAEPDPLRLLQGVVRARQRIVSGSIEFQLDTFSTRFQSTNRLRVVALFEGNKKRFEQFGTEYSYTYDPTHARQEEIKARADAFGADKEGAIRAGLLTGFESHYVTTDDGTSVLCYWENDGKPQSATISDRPGETSSYLFDPRCLGLSPALVRGSTLEDWLGLNAATPAEWVGQETIDGMSAWHVRMPSPSHAVDLWLDASDPVKVLKMQSGDSVITSKYDGSRSPFPIEVISIEQRHDGTRSGWHFRQTAAEFSVTLDPAVFTLAGLGMKIGTGVSDLRLHRQIGYWTGSGLSDDLPREKAAAADDAPTLEEMIEILDSAHPASPAAFDAARWILLNTPDGPEVEKAAAVLQSEHVRSPEMLVVAQGMHRMRHRCAEGLLQALLKDSPDEAVRATACFTLANLRKDACKFGADPTLAAEADALFTRVIAEFSQAGRVGSNLSYQARIELAELRRMSLGKAAPDLQGTDVKGRPVRLSTHQGNVAVIVFLSGSDRLTMDGPEQHFRLLAPFAGKPLVWIGVFCGDNLEKALVGIEKDDIPWPVIQDGRHGPLADAWNIRGWPSVFALDRQGIIRARDLRGQELVDTVAALLAE